MLIEGAAALLVIAVDTERVVVGKYTRPQRRGPHVYLRGRMGRCWRTVPVVCDGAADGPVQGLTERVVPQPVGRESVRGGKAAG